VTENYDHLGEAIKLLIGEREERFSIRKTASALPIQDMAG
jgi:hypothetical protein